MATPDPSTVTVQQTVTATVTQTSPSSTHQPPPNQAHPFPHAFPFAGPPPPMGYMPPVLPIGAPPPMSGQPGTLVSPVAAVLCILTVAGCYWAFKYLPQMQQQSANVSSTSMQLKSNSRLIAIDAICRHLWHLPPMAKNLKTRTRINRPRKPRGGKLIVNFSVKAIITYAKALSDPAELRYLR